jgi:hypothetical protein
MCGRTIVDDGIKLVVDQQQWRRRVSALPLSTRFLSAEFPTPAEILH